ncbi:MAG: hypothetical protein A2509_03155 [Candidatus Edwardsbacteria bacterium RIFOXYD12_FULL_50_11]|uniref:Uncharacterized protein n=1 Tax=Candidatus Edwardsbacteria bacterium GWF2_54_11 TaxID=1817851 RepID=A0A1F5RJ02_9BACT|nr:MAG: hypothetical protein A2502_07020 [Candidatus Edwardsbacteria bacterium RifOxyC12_full_54_24]OGF14021.1 MAG: hypothetical protein A2024_05665 [Candidatus Edwardsbacteria bacterium GWF2_54_11]OGF16026.1 MAG: hypothetical protein A2509_03155 [Candidatus Edwardsbacteria bacterium RIFOXYD12_FULL_50_11]OGJ17575.1 MAG: hypothetical protein A2349_04175 [Candidatus Edwardsbacteria bacterium RifOxyB12_full_52_30]OGT06075.1 MAG: hypothetical protein A2X78_04910 [Gammaproteobacteria bacterium GWE2_
MINISNNLSIIFISSIGLVGIVATVFVFVLTYLFSQNKKPFILRATFLKKHQFGPIKIGSHSFFTGPWHKIVVIFINFVFFTNIFAIIAELTKISVLNNLSLILLFIESSFFGLILLCFFKDFPDWVKRQHDKQILDNTNHILP